MTFTYHACTMLIVETLHDGSVHATDQRSNLTYHFTRNDAGEWILLGSVT